MKFLRFLALLFRKGTFISSRFDFEKDRRQVLAKFGIQPPNRPIIHSRLLSIPYVSTLAINFSYWRHAATMNRQWYVCDRHRLAYVRILKCGSTTVLKNLLPQWEPRLVGTTLTSREVDALAFYYVTHRVHANQRGYQAFVIVRNPLERLVSAYNDLFDPRSDHFTYSNYWFGVLKRKMSFEEFVRTIAQIPTSLLGPHFIPQTEVIRQSPFTNLTVLHLDKEKDRLVEFFSQHHWSLEVTNASSARYRLREYYSHHTLRLASELYRQDIEALGYQGELQRLREEVNT